MIFQKKNIWSTVVFLFYQDLDLVPTDIAAGLILVQKDQEKISAGSGRSYNTFTELSTR